MVDHEGHLGGGDGFGGDDEVAFVFAVGGVEHYYEVVVACVCGWREGGGGVLVLGQVCVFGVWVEGGGGWD